MSSTKEMQRRAKAKRKHDNRYNRPLQPLPRPFFIEASKHGLNPNEPYIEKAAREMGIKLV